MTKQDMVARLREKSAWVPEKRIKIDFGEQGVVLLDGVSGAIVEEDQAADTVVSVSWEDLQALGRGDLDPMSALMQGRLRIDGDMAGAMQLTGVIAQLRD